MSYLPDDLKYTKTHEWVRVEDDGTVTVGISDHAQELLGDLVFVELPEVGASMGAETECAVVESVKAASDIYCPLEGEVIGVNEVLLDAPETINDDPYEAGWIFKLQPADAVQADELMDAEAYEAYAEEDEG